MGARINAAIKRTVSPPPRLPFPPVPANSRYRVPLASANKPLLLLLDYLRNAPTCHAPLSVSHTHNFVAILSDMAKTFIRNAQHFDFYNGRQCRQPVLPMLPEPPGYCGSSWRGSETASWQPWGTGGLKDRLCQAFELRLSPRNVSDAMWAALLLPPSTQHPAPCSLLPAPWFPARPSSFVFLVRRFEVLCASK